MSLTKTVTAFSIFLCLSIGNNAIAGSSELTTEGELEAGFQTPPASARPLVWWHWLNGNVTREGIAKDLAWMSRTGLGGVQNFDANLGTPQVVEQRLVFMDQAWQEAFRFAVTSASDLGLEFGIAASPGWSETGGPWVSPADGMKKLVWSETLLEGGQLFDSVLTAPPQTTGPFQSVAFHDPLAGPGADAPALPDFYQDIAVLAYPITVAVLPVPEASSGAGVKLATGPLLDLDLESVTQLPKDQGEAPPTLVYTFADPVTIRSATLFIPQARPPFGDPAYLPVLEAEGPQGWRKITALPLTEVATTVSFDAITASRFRLLMAPNTGASTEGLSDGAPGAVQINIFAREEVPWIAIGQWQLSSEAKINLAETKAGFAVASDYYALESAAKVTAELVPVEAVVDLSDRMAKDGSLKWTPPAGQQWRVLRLGYSLTGKTNHPATAEATGLEVDKYDGAAVRRYLETYLSRYREVLGSELIGSHGLNAILTDSIEVGTSNWTAALRDKFKTLRGYDPLPWLPVLTGAIIGTPEQSEAFLFDFRHTLADLLASEHYGTIAEVAQENGLKIYGEALENGRPVLGDDMAMRAHATVPMAALWTYNRGAEPRQTLLGDMKGAASVAHVYGQNIAAAESLTAAFAPWAFAPSDLKRVIDLELVYGINRPIIHTSVHQPSDDMVPGLSLAIFGQYFNRHETWAEMARPWIDYISRSSFLLQKGRNFADVAWFYGEESPLTAQFINGVPEGLPVNYAYDFVNPDALANQLTVEGGELVAESGARYQVLYLGGSSERMTLPTLQRIAELVKQGATVVGQRPLTSPSLADDATAFSELAEQLWAGGAATTVGQGRVVASEDIEAVLGSMGKAGDFTYSSNHADSEVLFIHRRFDDGDAYFLTNRRNRPETIEARFRISGKQAEIWRAQSGSQELVSYRIEGEQTIVPLTMGPEDAFFVVFRKAATSPSFTQNLVKEEVVTRIEGTWNVRFQPGRGAPESLELAKLLPLNENDDPGIRYFSGTATYQTQFDLPDTVKTAEPIWLDLGQIGDVAEVLVNGKSAGIAWFPPYRVNVGALVHPGSNQVEVRVANLWVNRLIGDQQPGAEQIARVAAPTYLPNAPLRPSGLMGPVQLIQRIQ